MDQLTPRITLGFSIRFQLAADRNLRIGEADVAARDAKAGVARRLARPHPAKEGLKRLSRGPGKVTVPTRRPCASNKQDRGRMGMQDLVNPPAPLKLFTASP